MGTRALTVVLLTCGWFVYNTGLLLSLFGVSGELGQDQWNVLTTMSVLSLGVNIMYYDIWEMRRTISEKSKRKGD